jgi:hypothetical protein
MTRKTNLDQEPMPSHPSETGSGTPSRQMPPAPPTPIDTHEIHERVKPTTGSYHDDE